MPGVALRVGTQAERDRNENWWVGHHGVGRAVRISCREFLPEMLLPDSDQASIGLGRIYIGRAEETEAHVAEALRLSPRDTLAYTWMFYAGVASTQLGHWEQGVAWLRRSIEANRNIPHAHFVSASALAQLGRLEEAHSAFKTGLALDPAYAVSRLQAYLAAISENPKFLAGAERILDGMRKAGVPER
jgi:tetratricopeptide (TPR) repeat protein